MYGRFSFVVYVGLKPFCAMLNRKMKTAEQLFDTMRAIFDCARLFRSTASLYVYELNAADEWRLCDSCGQKLGDNPPMALSDDFINSLKTISHAKERLNKL